MSLPLYQPMNAEQGTQTVFTRAFFGLLPDDEEGVTIKDVAKELPHPIDLLTMIGAALGDIGLPEGETPAYVTHVEMRVTITIDDSIHDVAVQNQWLPTATEIADDSAVMRLLSTYLVLPFEATQSPVKDEREKQQAIRETSEAFGDSVDGHNVAFTFEVTPYKK